MGPRTKKSSGALKNNDRQSISMDNINQSMTSALAEDADELRDVFINWQIMRFAIVALLVVYGGVSTYLYIKYKNDFVKREDIRFIHTIWFGEHGILAIVFFLLMTVMLMLVAMPLLRKYLQ
jgi:hypothetical protein